MKYAQKTADNSGLFLKNGQPDFVFDPATPSEFWPVDETVPFDYEQIGWDLVKGTVVAVSRQRSPSFKERTELEISQLRAEAEKSKPTVVGGIAFGNDFESRLKLVEAIVFSAPLDVIRFHDASGVIQKVTREELQAVASKLLQTIELLAATEETLKAQFATIQDKDVAAFAESLKTAY